MKSTIATIALLLVSAACVQGQQKEKPTTLKGVLLEQLRTTHNQEDWFAPASIAVEGITSEQANWKSGKDNHSIGELTAHLLFWDRHSLAQFEGKPAPKYSGNNDDTFTSFDNKSWPELTRQLDEVLTEWEKAVEAADDKTIAANASLIAHIGTHNAYHIGQMVYIRKEQGSWNPAKGVK